MRIPRVVLDAIAAHARRESPRECCGLLIGTPTGITEAIPTTNGADDPLRRYEIPPAEHLAQIRRCRAVTGDTGTTITVVGAYHSHPHGAPVPSPTDLEQAFEDFLYVIAGEIGTPAPADIRAYRLRNGRFEAEELTVDELPRTALPHATAR